MEQNDRLISLASDWIDAMTDEHWPGPAEAEPASWRVAEVTMASSLTALAPSLTSACVIRKPSVAGLESRPVICVAVDGAVYIADCIQVGENDTMQAERARVQIRRVNVDPVTTRVSVVSTFRVSRTNAAGRFEWTFSFGDGSGLEFATEHARTGTTADEHRFALALAASAGWTRDPAV